MVVRHGNSPVRHATRGIFLRYSSESIAGFLVPKGMEHRHRAAELRLNRWFAGNGEAHLAEFARIACGMLMLGNRWWHECGAHAHKQHHAKGESLHAGLLGY
jgi:hypothetical protein